MGKLVTTSVAASVLILLVAVWCGAVDENSTAAPMERSEQDALYSVIQGFVGNWWDGRQLYPDPCGFTAIQGVGCDLVDGLWRITSLNLGPVLDNSLGCSHTAEFTNEIFHLTYLRSLSLFECFTSTNSSIPTTRSWSNLSSLTTLEFRSNPKLVGQIPSSFSLIGNLQSLVITDSSLVGRIPPELAELTHLRRLLLAGNSLSGEIPAKFGEKMKQLLILDLSRNKLVGSVPPSIGELSSLLKLDLSGNSIDGRLPESIGKLKTLTLLDLRNNRVTGGLPNWLANAGSLQALLLSNNPLGGRISGFDWWNLKQLNTLDLSRTSIEGIIPDSITEMKELRFLALDNNKLSGGVPAKIADLPNLGALYLNGNNLTGALGFHPEFYVRLGRRFSVWGNPNLCYSSAGSSSVPAGVVQCRGDAPPGNSSGSNSVGTRGQENSAYSSSSTGGFLSLFLLLIMVSCLDFGL